MILLNEISTFITRSLPLLQDKNFRFLHRRYVLTVVNVGDYHLEMKESSIAVSVTQPNNLLFQSTVQTNHTKSMIKKLDEAIVEIQWIMVLSLILGKILRRILGS